MGQFKHVGNLGSFSAKNLPVLVTDDPLPAAMMLVMTQAQYEEILRTKPGAIQGGPISAMGDPMAPSGVPGLAMERRGVPTNRPPVTLDRDFRFPPDAGKWFRTPEGDIILGCPRCGTPSGIKAPPFRVLPNGYVEPSFMCEKPGCGCHCMVRLDGLNPDDTKCPTCGCEAHTKMCDVMKGGSACGCLVGTGWEPIHVEGWPPVEN